MSARLRCAAISTHQLGGIHANDTSRRGTRGQFGQAAPVSASEVEDLIAPIDAERIHHPQILAPGFTSHDEGNYPDQHPPRISGVFGDKAGATHAQPLVASIFGLQCVLWPSGWLAENERRPVVSENVAANQCVGWLSAAHPVLGKTISAHFLRLWIYRERILKICPRRSKLQVGA